MGLIAKLKRAAEAFRSDRSEGVFAAATVRSWEVNDHSTRPQMQTAASLVARFTGIVKIAAEMNAQAIASLPLRVYKKSAPGKKTSWRTRAVRRKSFASCGRIARKMADTGDDLYELVDEDHPYTVLLENANRRDNGFALIEDTALWMGIAGNAYWWTTNAPVPESLWPLAPQFVHAVPSRETMIGAYIYGRGYENERQFPAQEIVHFRNPNPLGDPYRGRGDLEACCEEADLGKSFIKFALATVNNGAQPGMILSSEQWVTEDQIKKAREAYESMFAGPFKAGKSLFLNGKVNATPWSMTDKEIAFLSSSERIDQVVALCFGIPTSLLKLETAALATAKESIPQWQIRAIRPRARRIEDQINQDVSRRFGEDIFVAFDDPVEKDWTDNATVVSSLVGKPVLTVNEGRQLLDFEPIDGGDELHDPASELGAGGFGGGDGAGESGGDGSGGAGGRKRPAGEDAGGKHREHEHGVRGGGAMRIAGAIAVAASSLILAPEAKSCCDRPPRTQVKDWNIVIASEAQLEAALRQFFSGLTPQVVESVQPNGAVVDLSESPGFAVGLNGAASHTLRQLYDAGATLGLADISSMADPTVAREAMTAGARDYLDKYTGRMSRSVSDTLDRQIRGALKESIKAGGTVDDMRDAVQDVMDGATRWGAERIARTESARAFLSAREEAWITSGIQAKKKWLLSADPCPICRAIASSYNSAKLGESFVGFGETIPLPGGGSFTADYSALFTPPAHPACRCSIAMEVV